MAAAAAPIAIASSVASLGMKAAGDVTQGYATQQQDNVRAVNATFQGEQQQRQFGLESSRDLMEASGAETAAEFGQLKADMTDAAARSQLTTTLGNITVQRLAGGTDLTSPTTAALEGHVTDIANLNREAAVSSINTQTAQEKAAADYERQAANFALTQGGSAAAMGKYNADALTSAGNTAVGMGFLTGASDILGGLGKAFAGGGGGAGGGMGNPTQIGSLY